MFLLFRILPTILLLIVVSVDCKEEQETCDKKCIFEPEIVTSRTLKLWPKDCETVCGDIILNSKCNSQSDQLKEAFLNLKTLVGKIKIEKTRLKDISFFPKMRIKGYDAEIIIRNNSYLTDIVSLMDMCHGVKVELSGNPKLDPERFCDSACFLDAVIEENQFACGYYDWTNFNWEANKKDKYQYKESEEEEEEEDEEEEKEEIKKSIATRKLLLSKFVTYFSWALLIVELVTGTFHCLILLRNEFNEYRFFYFLYLITLCNLIISCSYALDGILDSNWIYPVSNCGPKHFHALANIIDDSLRNFLLKVISTIAFFTCLMGTLSVIHPTSGRVLNVSNSPLFPILILILSAVYFVADLFFLVSHEPEMNEGYMLGGNPCMSGDDPYASTFFYPSNRLINQIRDNLNKTVSFTIIILQIIFAIRIIWKRCSSRRPRRHLFANQDFSKNIPPVFVLSLVLLYLVSEIVHGACRILEEHIDHRDFLQPKSIVWTVTTLSPILQFILCSRFSPLYRQTLQYLLYRKSSYRSRVYTITNTARRN